MHGIASRRHIRIPTTAAAWRRWTIGSLLAAAAAAAPAQTTTPREVQVTPRYIIDFEFDWGRDGVYCASCNHGAGNSRLVYVDLNNKVWVGQVDFQTGRFTPADGRGVLVDTLAALPTDFGNGPEWMFSALGSQLVYTRYQNDLPPSPETAGLVVATQLADGNWTAGFLENGLKRQSPLGTLDLADPVPRIQYQDVGKLRTLWRSVDNAASEAIVPTRGYNGGSRRWVPGTHKIILTGAGERGLPGFNFRQVYVHDTDTNTSEQLTEDLAHHSGAMMWQAPEYGNEWVFFSVRNSQQLVVHRQLPNSQGVLRWTPIATLTPPPETPYVWSPEYFVFNGKSYIFFQLNVTSDSGDLTQPSTLAMTGILPENTGLTMLTPPDAPPRVRMDPEYFITAQGPFIYYNRYKLSPPGQPGAVPDGVWRVDTGLGTPPATNFRQGRR